MVYNFRVEIFLLCQKALWKIDIFIIYLEAINLKVYIEKPQVFGKKIDR